MAFCRIVFPLLVLSVVSATTVPVYLWGNPLESSSKSNPLAVTTAQEFRGILKNELVDDPFLLVFIEESLSPEDFSRKNETKALRVRLSENGLTADIEDENNKVVFIVLSDAKDGESRYDTLRRHNDFMEEQFSKFEGNNVIGLYTARKPSWIIPESHFRVRRQAPAVNVSTPDYFMDGLRLYAKKSLSHGNTTNVLSGFSSGPSAFNGTTMNTTMHFEQASLTLNFQQAGGYWFFDSVDLEQSPSVSEHLLPTSDVHALIDFSYRCKQFISFSSVNESTVYTVSFEDMKIQPFFASSNESQPFGDSFNCVGFFSAPIWAGLFVVFILLAIMFYGVMMMMDIRTMDRFDDPKGKTITINAAE
ncbi:LOW QUALITY PROTEIN: V-type proton ATPase subunit S1 [Manduca sexta]|uniref:LOW QUALITY PROTEIN: V-type proton ATPase subunit S1 n=1 Tax=Manduca sexta TaxID=7130 RepID=UPI00188F97A8|nr:LOW QUALITY PROTEIN: V-type proton ATPase subunit S1 [Manduca sexta]